jgi:hypothetical protein
MPGRDWHNLQCLETMAGLSTDTPTTLLDAQNQLSEFLERQGWPTRVVWLQRNDLLPERQTFWVGPQDSAQTFAAAERVYEEGRRRGLGISVEAICADKKSTFAAIFLPRDEDEAQRLMIPQGLKLGVPVEHRRATVVNALRWAFLRMRFAFKSESFKESLNTYLDQVFAINTSSTK